MSSTSSLLTEFTESSLSNLRLSLLILTGVLGGYTLLPLPRWLQYQFENSNVFKFFILVIIGVTALWPINGQKLQHIIATAIIILLFFHLLRSFDEKGPIEMVRDELIKITKKTSEQPIAQSQPQPVLAQQVQPQLVQPKQLQPVLSKPFGSVVQK
jgi:Ca2+/Na+ antiporter